MSDTHEKTGKPLGEFLLDAGKRIVEIERERNEARLRVLELEATAAAWQEERDNICAALGEHPESPLDIPERIRQIRDEGRAWMHGADVRSRDVRIEEVVRLTAELMYQITSRLEKLEEMLAKQAQAALAAHESLRNQTK